MPRPGHAPDPRFVGVQLALLMSFLLGDEAGEVTFSSSDFLTTDREVWRVSPIPEPGALPMLLAGVAALAKLGARRAEPASKNLE